MKIKDVHTIREYNKLKMKRIEYVESITVVLMKIGTINRNTA